MLSFCVCVRAFGLIVVSYLFHGFFLCLCSCFCLAVAYLDCFMVSFCVCVGDFCWAVVFL